MVAKGFISHTNIAKMCINYVWLTYPTVQVIKNVVLTKIYYIPRDRRIDRNVLKKQRILIMLISSYCLL